MKKSLVLVMALVLVVSFAFADQVGEASLGTEKGVVTAGDPVNVNFSLTVKDSAEDVTTIEVMGDEVADNVFVMLIKDKPNDAQYEAKKVQDPDAKKTTYYIKAQELQGQNVKVYAELIDWKNETVMSDEATFNWKENTVAKNLQLTPPEEGLYTVKAYIEFGDGTRMELKGWGGYAQLVALDNYVKETVPGLTAELQDAAGDAVEYGSANELSVSAGVEFMYQMKDAAGDDASKTYLGVYGAGSQSAPTLEWTYTESDQPEGEQVKLVYAEKPGTVDSAYIKFRIMTSALEGDCCGTTDGYKWAMWLAIGTGEYHDIYSSSFSQSLAYHVLGTELYNDEGITVIKGAECKGWVKAIFYLDPSDVELWLYAIVGTQWDMTGVDGSYYVGNDQSASEYDQNMMKYAELNIIGEATIKDTINVKGGALNIGLGSDVSDATPSYFGSVDVVLESDEGPTVEVGAFAGELLGYEYSWHTVHNVISVDGGTPQADPFDYYVYGVPSTPTTLKVWKAHVVLGSLDIAMNDGFPFEALNTVRLGAFASGQWGDNFSVDSLDLMACFSPDITCCVPEFKVGVGFGGTQDDMKFQKVFANYTHDLGTYGPVTLTGDMGAIFVMDNAGGGVDEGPYGNTDSITGLSAPYFDGTSLGLAYEVTGTMTW